MRPLVYTPLYLAGAAVCAMRWGDAGVIGYLMLTAALSLPLTHWMRSAGV